MFHHGSEAVEDFVHPLSTGKAHHRRIPMEHLLECLWNVNVCSGFLGILDLGCLLRILGFVLACHRSHWLTLATIQDAQT